MKKKLLIIILSLVLVTVFPLKEVTASQAMGLCCDIEEKSSSSESFLNTLYYKFGEYKGEQTIVLLTDSNGEKFWRLLDVNGSSLDMWLKNTTLSKYNEYLNSGDMDAINKHTLNETAFSKYCPKYIATGSVSGGDNFLAKVQRFITSSAAYSSLDPVTIAATVAFKNLSSTPISLIFFDTSTPLEDIGFLENEEYVIYYYEDSDGEGHNIAEGYTKDGRYIFIGPDLPSSLKDEVFVHQENLIRNRGYDEYYDIYNYRNLLVFGNGTTGDYSVCEGKKKSECENDNEFKIILSNDPDGKRDLKENISDWVDSAMNDEDGKLKKFDEIINIANDGEFIDTMLSIKNSLANSTEYNFDGTNVDNFINKLDNGVVALQDAFSVKFVDCGYPEHNTNITSSIFSCVVYKTLGIKNIVDLADEDDSDHMVNAGLLVSMLYNDAKDMIREVFEEKNYSIDILDSSDNLSYYTELMYTSIAYLKSRADSLGLDKGRLKDIYESYKVLVESNGLNIYPVVDCETLLGENLINKINSYMNIIKIAVPIIIICFGIIDFTKAIFAGQDEMKKAKNRFVKRLIIAVLIFLTPVILNLLLSVANNVWKIISPDSCGIF